MKSTQQLRAKLDSLRKASQIAEVKAPPPPQEVKLSEAAAELPEHIRQVTSAAKLNEQTRFFKCPAWADLPSKAYHFFVTREGVPFPALELQRFPFYLFGKSTVCDYVLEHPSVSSVHAAIVFHKTQNCFVLVDLRSTNGSRVDGKAVEAGKPVPLPVGAVVQFGTSTRQYTVRAGPAPSAKRIREERDEVIQARHKAEIPAPTAPTATDDLQPSPSPPLGTETTAVASHLDGAPTEGVEGTTEVRPVADLPAAPTTEAIEDAAAEDTKRMHLYQLVIKHKDVKNPVSRGRNKGEVITRSAADALQVAQFILQQHDSAHRASESASSPASSEFVPWTVEEFTEAVLEYCEMSNPKKKGDLGLVEEGTFAPAFDRAAFALRRHEVSSPVETELGVHLIYRCD